MLCNFVGRQWSQFQVLFKRCNIRHLSWPLKALASVLSTPYLRNLMSKLVGLIKGSPFVFVFVSFSQWSACVVCPMPGRLISASLARTQSEHCAVCSVHCTLYSVQCALHTDCAPRYTQFSELWYHVAHWQCQCQKANSAQYALYSTSVSRVQCEIAQCTMRTLSS